MNLTHQEVLSSDAGVGGAGLKFRAVFLEHDSVSLSIPTCHPPRGHSWTAGNTQVEESSLDGIPSFSSGFINLSASSRRLERKWRTECGRDNDNHDSTRGKG